MSTSPCPGCEQPVDGGPRTTSRRPRVVRVGVAVPLLLSAVVLAGCGGGGDDQASTRVENGVTVVSGGSGGAKTGDQESATSKTPPIAPDKRASVLRTSLVQGTATGKKKSTQNRFKVSDVRVTDGRVTVTTDDAGQARGACAWIAGAENWMQSVTVVGKGSTPLATWKKGQNPRCTAPAS